MKQLINLGTGPNSGLGDTLYSGSVKINENFDELYQTIGNAVTLDHIQGGTGIRVDLTPGLATVVNTQPNVQSDWNSSSGLSAILNKPVLSSIAYSGSYNDLLDAPIMPTLSAVALSGEYGDLLNAPEFPVLADVALSGDYFDLTNLPQQDRLTSGVFSAVLDSGVGEFRIPDSLRFTLSNSDSFIHGPGSGHALTINAGLGDTYVPNGGSLNLFSGNSIAQLGDGGELSVVAGNGASVGGNVIVRGGNGVPYTAGDFPGRGGSVNITAGYGQTYGGNVVITAGMASAPGTGSNPAVTYPGEVVIQAGSTAQWRYAYDGSVHRTHAAEQTTSVTCPNDVVTEVYASVNPYTPLIKLLITVTGLVTGDETGEHVEALEALIVCRPSGGTPVVQLVNRTQSAGPLVLVTAAVHPTTHLVTVYCKPTDVANSIQVITLGIEPNNVMSGQVIT